MNSPTHYSIDNSNAYSYVDTETCTEGGVMDNPVVRLYPTWKNSRSEINNYIKHCPFALFSWGSVKRKIFWTGKHFDRFVEMLTGQELSAYRTLNSVDIEESVFQMRRTAFVDCMYLSTRDLELFVSRNDVGMRLDGFVIDLQFFNWWHNLHSSFKTNNVDCIGIGLKEKPEGTATTARDILFNWLLFRADDLVNA